MLPMAEDAVLTKHLDRILFPTDFSEASRLMALQVRELAVQFHSEIAVLHSFNAVRDCDLADRLDVSGNFPTPPVPYMPEFARLRDREQEDLQHFAISQFPDVRCSAMMEDGDPATVICKVAERDDTDLIMMATKGLGTFRRVLLGSVTAKVLHDATCAVFASAHECDTASPRRVGYRAVLCAIELNDEAEKILRTARSFAQIWDASLSVIHMAHRQHVIVPSDHATDAQFDAFLRRVGVTAPSHLLNAEVAEGIRRAATEQAADLVIVGRGRDRGKISRLWSNLYEIVRESPCPVLSL